ncbi:MAG: RNA 2',3'-cyclic phosphodiesterase [Gammaproteobacteria bacterium]|nr:RNA 2',3'-cyclic phosphodiesterase [Gammaproteobacteria bacterium]
MTRLRLFLALWPDTRVRDRLHTHRDAWQWPATATLVPPGRLHLTLHFLGAVDAGRMPDLTAGLQADFRPFRLVLDRTECWAGGLAILAPGTLPAELSALHESLGARLAALGLPPETRGFRPHVTLARRSADARPPARFLPLSWRVQDYALVVSEAGPPPAYRVLARYC